MRAGASYSTSLTPSLPAVVERQRTLLRHRASASHKRSALKNPLSSPDARDPSTRKSHTQRDVATSSRSAHPGTTRKRSEPFIPGSGASPLPKASRTTANSTTKLRNDRLGALVAELSSAFLSAESWEDFVHQTRGRSYLNSDLPRAPHPARFLLDHWRTDGVPVNLDSPPLAREELDTRVE